MKFIDRLLSVVRGQLLIEWSVDSSWDAIAPCALDAFIVRKQV
jgi:hypothetical protein